VRLGLSKLLLLGNWSVSTYCDLVDNTLAANTLEDLPEFVRYIAFRQEGSGTFTVVRIALSSATTLPFPVSESAVFR
jgi:hypothetical protein